MNCLLPLPSPPPLLPLPSPKDGNLEMLKEELNKTESVDLDEPSNTPVPYPPLFIAYMNDHYQVCS